MGARLSRSTPPKDDRPTEDSEGPLGSHPAATLTGVAEAAPPSPPAFQDTTREAPSAATGTTWGPFRLLERIGQGGFGEVFRAYDPALQREVALKLVRF